MQSFLIKTNEAQEAFDKGDWETAGDLWLDLYRQNPLNKDFAVSAANAFYRAGDYEQAIDLYNQAKSYSVINPATLSYNIACCYALREEPEQALLWLNYAIDEGFSNISNAHEDSDLQIVRETAEFKQLFGLDISSDADHDTGWRYDLNLMVNTIKRIAYKPFHRSTEAEFDVAVQNLYEQIPHLDDTKIALEMIKIVTMIGDGHTRIFPNSDKINFYEKFIPIEFFWLGECLIVLSADPNYAHLVTDWVTHIEGQSVGDLRAMVEPLHSKDNDIWLEKTTAISLTNASLLSALGVASSNEKLTLSLVTQNGQTRTEVIDAKDGNLSAIFVWHDVEKSYATEPAPSFLKSRHKNYWLEKLPEHKALYIQLNQVRDMPDTETLGEFASRVQSIVSENQIKNIIVDVRWNTGGNTYLCMPLLNYLIGYNATGMGHIFAIIGRRTFSAAQNFVSLLERHSDTIFVGEPTGSSPNFIGETRGVPLPYSGLFLTVSDLFWQNSVPTDSRPYIAPHISAPLTAEAIVDGRDPAIEAILHEIDMIATIENS